MIRTSIALLGLLAVMFAITPAVCAQATLGADARVDSAAQVPVGAPDVGTSEMPSVQVPLHGLVPSAGGRDADETPNTPAGAPPQRAASKSFRMPDLSSAQKVATAAGAGAGLAILLALAAHAAGVPLFSRIQANRLLDNGVRQRVHDTIIANPGITIKEITGVCAIGWGTAVYHLKRLESERLIVSERNRQFRRYFKNGGGIVNDSKSAFGELKNPVTERLAHSIMAAPGRCQKELCETVGISAPLAHKFLSRMADAGLVSTQREWKTVRYFPTTKLHDLLLVTRPGAAQASAALAVAA